MTNPLNVPMPSPEWTAFAFSFMLGGPLMIFGLLMVLQGLRIKRLKEERDTDA